MLIFNPAIKQTRSRKNINNDIKPTIENFSSLENKIVKSEKETMMRLKWK